MTKDSVSSETQHPATLADDTAVERLLRYAKLVLAGLEHRIGTAPAEAVPVFDGIAELHDAINAFERKRK